MNAVRQCGFDARSKDALRFGMVGERDLDFVSGVEIADVARSTHGIGNNRRELIYCIRNICPNIKGLISCSRTVDGLSNDWCNVIDMRECPLLQAISEDCHRLAAKKLIHKNAN